MLRRLTIRDFVLVDRLELEFGMGFGTLTGETGAGKSILVDALAFALGERADAGLIRNGSERAEVTAEFDLAGSETAASWLREHDLEADEGLLLRRVLDGNLRAARNAGLEPASLDTWYSAIVQALERNASWCDQRGTDGFIRRGHGDLHLGNLCLWQGRPVPFDALEFDEDLATIDLGYDLAFLLMDLEHSVGRPAANRVLNRYIARTGDVGLLQGLPLFLSSRALIRAHVEATHGHAAPSQAYLAAAIAYLQPAVPLIVAIGGLQGTGKSTLARALAPDLGPAPGALIPRSDEIRKRQFGVMPEAKLPPRAYASAAGKRVFAELTRQAETAARAGHAVVADATFISPDHRDALRGAATAAGVPFLGLWLEAPLDILAARIAGRSDDASDATVAVLEATARSPNARAGDWIAIPAHDRDTALAAARKAVMSTLAMC